MATYEELRSITEDSGWGAFYGKIKVASVIKAQTIIDSTTPTTVALDWAKDALSEPKRAADSVVWYVIAANNGAAISAILGATDNAIQTNVSAAVDVLYP